MMSTVLPPTVNAFTPQQRIRLMRSTRKLGALLGTTPHVVLEEDDLPTKRRVGVIFDNESVHSLNSLLEPAANATATAAISFKLVNSHEPQLSRKPPTLVLSVQPCEELALRPRSPLSPSFLNVSSPTSTSTSSSTSTSLSGTPASLVDIRRKKMAKLTRTLGENIPPELVFAQVQSQSHDSGSLAPVAEASTSSSSLSTTTSSIAALPAATETNAVSSSTTTARQQLRAQRGRSWSVDTQSSTTGLISAPKRTSSRPFDSYLPQDKPSSYSSSSSSTTATTPTTKQRPSIKTSLTSMSSGIVRSASMRLRSNTLKTPIHDEDGTPFESMAVRKEKEWSGEWNQNDMDQVVNRLRNLKAPK